ncbi:hypothetical protein E2C01_008455 [Portunus trituberculatus]|uniref:Uncharacterized protein n=1 Tax=Portunus trituberculatus TaxID=210409 RepID=A0A5B7D0V9_PORTR|nr:hypothetical protein [Portunus trituberculatus]
MIGQAESDVSSGGAVIGGPPDGRLACLPPLLSKSAKTRPGRPCGLAAVGRTMITLQKLLLGVTWGAGLVIFGVTGQGKRQTLTLFPHTSPLTGHLSSPRLDLALFVALPFILPMRERPLHHRPHSRPSHLTPHLRHPLTPPLPARPHPHPHPVTSSPDSSFPSQSSITVKLLVRHTSAATTVSISCRYGTTTHQHYYRCTRATSSALKQPQPRTAITSSSSFTSTVLINFLTYQ